MRWEYLYNVTGVTKRRAVQTLELMMTNGGRWPKEKSVWATAGRLVERIEIPSLNGGGARSDTTLESVYKYFCPWLIVRWSPVSF